MGLPVAAALVLLFALSLAGYHLDPRYAREDSRAAAAVLLEQAANGATAADVLEGIPSSSAGSPVPAPRTPSPGERVPA